MFGQCPKDRVPIFTDRCSRARLDSGLTLMALTSAAEQRMFAMQLLARADKPSRKRASVPSFSSVRHTGRWDCSTRRMISSFSEAGYLIPRLPHPLSCVFLSRRNSSACSAPPPSLGNAFTAAQLGDTGFAAQAIQHSPDVLRWYWETYRAVTMSHLAHFQNSTWGFCVGLNKRHVAFNVFVWRGCSVRARVRGNFVSNAGQRAP